MQRGIPDSPPLVSVIIPVFNVETYLRQCLDSLVDQTMTPDQLEVIGVDDGSTDHSGLILDEYADRFAQVRAIHQPPSGGPGRPRNVGLDHATGRYIFFLDADDYLGREALERLTAMAERAGSDIVLGKMVGIDGRMVPERPFRRSLERATLADVYSTLSVLKLYRRDFLQRTGCRLAEGPALAEDTTFAQLAYLEADVISVVADYDCYYYRRRPGSQTNAGLLRDFVAHLDRMGELMERLAAYVEPGPGRDVLMVRHMRDVVGVFNRRWSSLEPTERRRTFEVGSALIKRWQTPGMYRLMHPSMALRAYCAENGLLSELVEIARCPPAEAIANPVVDGKRLFARFPHFRDAAGIPDEYFDITNRVHLRQRLLSAEVKKRTLSLSGESYLSAVGGTTTVVLRRSAPKGPVHRFPTTSFATPHTRDTDRSYPDAGFRVDLDLRRVDGRRLPRGLWEIVLDVGTEDIRRTAPLLAGDRLTTAAEVSRAQRWLGRINLEVTAKGQLRIRIGPRLLTSAIRRVEKGRSR